MLFTNQLIFPLYKKVEESSDIAKRIEEGLTFLETEEAVLS